MSETSTGGASAPPPTGWRVKLGTIMFIVPVFSAVVTPVILQVVGLSAAETASLIGGIVVGGEIIWFASIPLLGQEGFKALKDKLFGYFKLTEGPISQARHRFGTWAIGSSLAIQGLLLIWIVLGYVLIGDNREIESLIGLSI